jgi:hypothetical protein
MALSAAEVAFVAAVANIDITSAAKTHVHLELHLPFHCSKAPSR